MSNPLLKFKKSADNWSCDSCMLSNPPDLTKCQACQTDKPASGDKKPAANPLSAFAQKSGWACDTCLLQNDDSSTKCSACETPKPGAKPAEKPASSGSLFCFSLCVCLYKCMFVHMSICTYVCLYTCLFVLMSVCTHVFLYTYLFVYMSICTHICRYMLCSVLDTQCNRNIRSRYEIKPPKCYPNFKCG